MALPRSRLISCALFNHLSFRPQVVAIGRRYPYNFLQQPSHHLVAKYNILHQYILFKHKTIMADTTAAGTKSSGTNEADDSKQPDSSNNKGKNSKQRKAARWKQMNKKKKDRKRANLGLDTNGDAKSKKQKPSLHWTKKYDDDKPVTPHEGSFAHVDMQKKFGVSIDLDDTKKKVEEEATDNNNTTIEPGTDDASTTAVEDDTPKIPKRKLAMLVSFKGSNYSGFQININAHTLQAEIELALYRAGVISQRNFGHPGKYSWSNSARTDKGVHAAAQVCSLKGEMIKGDDLDAMRMKVNEYMPEDIRVLDFERVTRMFCARTNRDKVRYQYMVPSYLLCSQEEVRKAFDAVPEEKSHQKVERMTPILASNLVEENISSEVLDHARAALINHRVTSEQMERLKNGLKLFEGTHNFHNYTRRLGANDASSSRYILSFVPLEPIIVPGVTNEDGSKQPDTQWIPLQVVGQSFLLNQIRKMVSAAVDLAREAVSTEMIEQSLTKDHRIKVNVAPAQGLFLDRSFFDLYNKHKANNTPDRVTLDWVEKEGEEIPAAVQRIEEFKNEKIIPHIVQEEADEGNFLRYLYAQDILYKDEIYTDRVGVAAERENEKKDEATGN